MANILGFPATQSGNVITLVKGTYGGFWMSARTDSGPIIIDGNGSTVTGTITLPDSLSDVTFQNFNFVGTVGECFRASPNPATEKVGVCYKNLAFKKNTTDKCYSFCLFGTYSDITLGLSQAQNIEFSDNIITNSGSNQVFFITKTYGLICRGNIITTTGSPAYDAAFSHDGIFFLRWCDGEFFNNVISGHKGNGFRIYPSGITKGVAGNINIHDNYIHEGRAHSAFETNGNNSPSGYFANISIKNNTVGNLAAGAYHSAVLSAYPQPSGSKVYFENNIGFNTNFSETATPPAPISMRMIFTDTGTKTDSNINNWYYDTATLAGVDLATGNLLPTAPQYGKAGAWVAAIPTSKILASIYNAKTGHRLDVFDDDKVTIN